MKVKCGYAKYATDILGYRIVESNDLSVDEINEIESKSHYSGRLPPGLKFKTTRKFYRLKSGRYCLGVLKNGGPDGYGRENSFYINNVVINGEDIVKYGVDIPVIFRKIEKLMTKNTRVIEHIDCLTASEPMKIESMKVHIKTTGITKRKFMYPFQAVFKQKPIIYVYRNKTEADIMNKIFSYLYDILPIRYFLSISFSSFVVNPKVENFLISGTPVEIYKHEYSNFEMPDGITEIVNLIDRKKNPNWYKIDDFSDITKQIARVITQVIRHCRLEKPFGNYLELYEFSKSIKDSEVNNERLAEFTTEWIAKKDFF